MDHPVTGATPLEVLWEGRKVVRNVAEVVLEVVHARGVRATRSEQAGACGRADRLLQYSSILIPLRPF